MDFQGDTQEKTQVELVLVTASINHEYAKKELDKTQTFHRREELLNRMSHLKCLYFNAREVMVQTDPVRLSELEEELLIQKRELFTEFNA